MNKKWIFLVVVLIAIAAMLLFVKTQVQARLDPRSIQAQLTQALGFPTHIQRVQAGWKGDVDLLGVTLGQDSKPFLTAPTVRARVYLLDLLHGKVSVKSVTLSGPELFLDDETVAKLSQSFHQNRTAGQQFPVNVSQGAFRYTALNGKMISLNKINGSLTLLPQGAAFHLTLADPQNGRYDLSGTASTDTLNMQGKLKDVTLSEIVSPFGVSPIPELQGKISGQVSASGPLNHLTITSEFTEKSGFFVGDAVVNATLVPTATGAVLQGKLNSSGGEIEGIGKFKNFGVGFSTPSEGFVFQNGSIEFPSGILQFSGVIEKNYNISVKFKGDSFNPFVLPTFSGWDIRAPAGRIAGSAQGRFPTLTVVTQGEFPSLEIGQSHLDHARFALKGEVASRKAHLDSLKLFSPRFSLSIVAALKWDDKQNLTVDFQGLDARQMASLFNLGKNLFPMEMVLAGSTSYEKSTQTWTGNVKAPAGVIAGQSFDRFHGGFSYQAKAPVSFSGTFEMGKSSAVLAGTWKNGQGNLKLDAVGVPLQQIPFLKGTAQGFRGIGTIHAQFSTAAGSESRVDFSLPQATYLGKPFPAATGSISIRGDEVHLSPLRLTQMSPPLSITGDYNLKSKAMKIVANLNGQNPGSLLSLVSAQPMSMSGLLFGPAEISGTYPNLSLRFTGDVSNAHFQGFTFDRGHLVLAGTLPNHFQVDFSTDNFSLAKFALTHQFLPQLEGTGTLHVKSQGEKSVAVISVSIRQASWAGKTLGALQGSFRYEPPLLMIEELRLPLTTPPLSLSGRADLVKKSVEFRSTLTGQSISELAKISSKSLGSADGNLYGTLAASGYPPHLKMTFTGTGKNLRFSGMDLGEADLNLEESGAGMILRASHIQASRLSILQKAFPGLSGELQIRGTFAGSGIRSLNFQLKKGEWKGKVFPTFEGALTMEPPVTKFSQINLGGITPPLSANGQVNSDTHDFHFAANLNGQSVAEITGLLGAGARDFDAHLYGPMTLSGNSGSTEARFSGTAKGLKFHQMSLGSGHLDLSAQSAAGNAFALHLKASEISAESVQLLAAHYPGISGNVEFDVTANTGDSSNADVNFSLTGASYQGRGFPEILGRMVWAAPRLEFSSLSLPKLSVPLTLTGAYNSSNDSIGLSGQLEGQMISELLLLAGSISSEANGRLHGPVTIGGSSRAPEIDFHGDVSGLAYKGVQLGNSRLDITAKPESLHGKLLLDSPASLDPNDSLVSNLLSRIPSIGGIIGSLTSNVIVTGVAIAGTPQHPEFTPIVERTSIQRNPQILGAPQQQQQPQQQSNPIFDILNQVLRPH